MTSIGRSNSRFGLKWLFVFAAAAAVFVRAGIWIEDRRNPKTDLVGKVVLKQGNAPAANVKVWACQAYRDLTLLGITDPDPTLTPPPTDAERTVYVTTNDAGEFRFRSLKRGRHYTLGIEDKESATQIVEVDATRRVQRIPPITASKGTKVSVQVAHLDPHARTLPALELQVYGPTVFEKNSPLAKELTPNGTAQLRVAPGLHSICVRGAPIVQFSPKHHYETRTYSDGQIDHLYLAFDNRSGTLTRIWKHDATGHLYVGVPFEGTRKEARDFAHSCELEHLKGHLLTISSSDEQLFLEDSFGEIQTWTGGTDLRSEGVWEWDDGPEEGQVFYRADQPKPHDFQRWVKGEPRIAYNYLMWECENNRARWRAEFLWSEMQHLIIEFSPESR